MGRGDFSEDVSSNWLDDEDMKRVLEYDKDHPQIQRCESCGPILATVYWHDGTYWCKACMKAEGWE
jgi:formamidopyrimidine-DNA glycosylase